MNALRLPLIIALLCAAPVMPALAQEASNFQPSTIDGLRYGVGCIQKTGVSTVIIKLVSTSADPIEGWYTFTAGGNESPRKAFALKPKGSMLEQERTTGGCSSGVTVHFGQNPSATGSPSAP